MRIINQRFQITWWRMLLLFERLMGIFQRFLVSILIYPLISQLWCISAEKSLLFPRGTRAVKIAMVVAVIGLKGMWTIWNNPQRNDISWSQKSHLKDSVGCCGIALPSLLPRKLLRYYLVRRAFLVHPLSTLVKSFRFPFLRRMVKKKVYSCNKRMKEL